MFLVEGNVIQYVGYGERFVVVVVALGFMKWLSNLVRESFTLTSFGRAWGHVCRTSVKHQEPQNLSLYYY